MTSGSRIADDIHTSHLTVTYSANGHGEGGNGFGDTDSNATAKGLSGGQGNDTQMEYSVATASTHAEEAVSEYAVPSAGDKHAGGRGVEQVHYQIRAARMKGYEGDMCTECGQFTMVRN